MESGLASKKLPVFCVVRDSESDDGTDSASPGKCSALPSHAFTPGHRHIRTPISGVCESYRICQHQCMGAGCVCYAGQFAAAAAVVIVVNLTQVRVIWEEGALSKRDVSFRLPPGKSAGHFWIND